MFQTRLVLWAIALIPLACAQDDLAPLFRLRLDSGVTFVNSLRYDPDFNVYRYRNFYNGGGVALGDVNGDERLDIFLTANQGPNRLYLNQGGWTFEDATEQAGVAGMRAWSTGVSMADVNGDGWLDIYVCNSGIVSGDDQRNELYINRGDATFVEQAAAYGLDDTGLSIHGVFFDYDRDGDLDLYLVNNSFKSIEDFDQEINTRHLRHHAGGDRLYRNDGSRFHDVSQEAGIYGSEIGFGLGVSVADANRDGWPDLYVSNDFFERDYFYLNRGDGTFEEVLETSMRSVSAAAMGADMADLTGNGYPDIFVTDMLPALEGRLKTVTSFDDWPRYRRYIRDDYFHQFTRNTLQIGLGPGPHVAAQFMEAGRYATVEASDWSWGALIADFDHDGYRDIFVANGVVRDLTNADYLVEVNRPAMVAKLASGDSVHWARLIDMIPSVSVSNHMFAGLGTLRFEDRSQPWGLDTPGFSNGSAYGDIDNDGDLDLVVSHTGQKASLYENRVTEVWPEHAWLQVVFEGMPPNIFGVGAQVTAWAEGRSWYAEQQPTRGYQSGSDPVLHFGLGLGVNMLDSLVVYWSGGRVNRLIDIATYQRLRVREDAARGPFAAWPPTATPAIDEDEPWLTPVSPQSLGLLWRHQENTYNDFEQQPLLFHMRSTEGPAVCVGDANGDGRQDLYLGGARRQPGSLWLQTRSGRFMRSQQPLIAQDSTHEDIACAWLDHDADGDQDLYVASGSSELPASSSLLIDRIYVNDGRGTLERHSFAYTGRQGFEPTRALAVGDVNQDQIPDLFVGARLRPFAFGLPTDGHLLLGQPLEGFREATDTHAPQLRELGMITAATWGDVDLDGDVDLVVAGEWMPLMVFFNDGGRLVRGPAGLDGTRGLWQSLDGADLDGDGDLDFVAGNHGLNSRFRAAPETPMEMWTADFDRNGRVEQVITRYSKGEPYPMALRHDLVEQIPALLALFPTYASFAGATVRDIFVEAQLSEAMHLTVTELRSLALINDGTGHFTTVPLPFEAQMSPIYAVLALPLGPDPHPVILLGGNLYEAKPQVGRYDASYGTTLSHTLEPVRWTRSGFWIDGAARAIVPLRAGERNLVVVARNNDSLRVFAYDP